MTLPAELPKRIRQLAVQPPGLPDGDWAWARDHAIQALRALTGTMVAVLEVDVYAMPFRQPEAVHIGRRAAFTYNPGELALQFAARSRALAEAFVREGGVDELVVLLFSGQDDADSGYGSYKVQAG